MADPQVIINEARGQDRQIVTTIDQFRASEFLTDVLSGATNYTSGQEIWTVTQSSIVRLRPLNIHVHNREGSAMTLLFRDGGITGSVVAGPFIFNATQGRTISEDDLKGRRFLSSIYAVVISGSYSAGMDINAGYILEPDPNAVGGYLE